MSYKNIIELINKGKLQSCILLYGIEEYLIDNAIKMAKKKFIDKSFEDINYMEFDKVEDNFDEFYEFVNTFPFMTEKKLCIVKEADFLTSTGSLKKGEEDKLLEFIKQGSESCYIMFLIKGGKPDSRKRIVKNLKDNKSVFEINKLNEAEITNYIIESFKKHRIEISLGDADYIANNSGYLEYESNVTLYEINNEIEKLSSYCMKVNKIHRNDIDLLMVKSIESNIFKLVDYICEGNKDHAFEILEEMLLNNTPEQFIIHMIIRQYRMLYQFIILQNKGYSIDNIMNEMKIKRFIAIKLSKLAKKLTLVKIDKYMDKFLEIDKKIKVGEIDKTIGLEIIANGIIN